MQVEIRSEAFDPWHELRRFESEVLGCDGSFGATAVFVGTMRDFNDGAQVSGMTLDYYPGMTERHLQRIGEEALARWPIDQCLLLHRVGDIEPGEAIVVVAAWSAHRGAAFDACRFLIEDLKSRAPFWKKERAGDDERWVSHNTPG
ncbi:MAG: molybdenum cofactor biosynthesis protein MoaE [Gammaproteobacteria bacterium]|nr:molybdenum cofactor biosynthesis protein MoaE [Gammaproteobacteria bacterium]